MAVVQGIREKVHLPIYDSLTIEPRKQLRDVEPSSTLRFFVNVQNKTKLETNLQSASLLPHYNTFEAPALRVVISDLPPEFPDEAKKTIKGLSVTNEDGDSIDSAGVVDAPGGGAYDPKKEVTADVELSLERLMDLLKEARAEVEKATFIEIEDNDDVKLRAADGTDVPLPLAAAFKNCGVDISVADIEIALKEVFDRKAPSREQIHPNDGVGTIIGRLVYNTVTTLYVGEKIMIQMPTWFFPGGAGPYSESGKMTTHGEPSPNSTFKFAEPIFIERQQNFRVEMEVPDADVLKEIQKIYGPMYIWVVLDGYMTRGVQ